MRRSVPMFLALMALAAPAGVRAQLPGGGMPGMRMGAGMPGMRPAEFLLARTAQLQLTDAQVVRLAAIARRGEAERQALRAGLDSMRTARRPGAPADSMRRAPRGPLMPAGADMQRLRERRHAEFKDAITVLTPDQQATLWETLSAGRGGPVRAAGFQRMGTPGAGGRGGVVRPRRPFPGGGPTADGGF